MPNPGPDSAPQNPFLELDEAGKPLCQLKLSLVLYLDYAPGAKRARRVYDEYMASFGSHIRVFQSTSWLGPAQEWNRQAQSRFERELLPAIQSHNDWGYGFSDGREIDYHLFMFHGYRPVTEAAKASFFRFEWPWHWDVPAIAEFAERVADTVPFLSGTGGYIISARPSNGRAYDRMYALCRRYWGLEAWNLDLTVDFMRAGYKCPSWLTLIGDRLLDKKGAPRSDVGSLDCATIGTAHGMIFRSRARPEFIDRNRNEPFPGERAIADGLLPLQVTHHEDFGGPAWTGNTMKWLYRFASAPGAVP